MINNLKGKKILLAVTGSIAAYKAGELIRLLRLQDAEVKIVMTKDACEFITELTLQALSGQPVHRELLDHDSEASMSHITLAKWADVLLIAPATANIIAKFANGIADDLLTTLYLATPAPTIIVPAMNQQMWQHPATIKNKETLMQRHVQFFGPSFGQQACGDVGPGRLLEPSEIILHLEHFFAPKILSGLKILITAGPTRESIDPVRYITNHSSGKMGYALAEVASHIGAETLLISGPTHLSPPFGAKTIQVMTAHDMHMAVMENINDNFDILIASAAVADYRCVNIAKQKIKKSTVPVIALEQTADILMNVSHLTKPPFLVGFAAESEDLLSNAKKKLEKKKLDMIIANKIGSEESGFYSDFNEVSILTHSQQVDLPLTTKKELAYKMLPLILSEYKKKSEINSSTALNS